MKTGLQSLLVVPHTHSLGRGISFWLAHSRWVIQRQDSFNLLQQYSGVQACQKLQEEWWPCRWQPSNWVVESSSLKEVFVPTSVARHQERSVEEQRGRVQRYRSAGCCLCLPGLGFHSQQSSIVLRLPIAGGKLQQGRSCLTGTRSNRKRMAWLICQKEASVSRQWDSSLQIA